jgi:hypothetical protein
MPAQPCANHPNEMTYVRCGRCDKPICVRCMVDTPVGKKCQECAQNRTHLTESTPRQVLTAFLVATLVAVPVGWVMHRYLAIILLAFVYGYLVAEVALRAGQRRRSLAMQVAAGLAALIGSFVGAALVLPSGMPDETTAAFVWPLALRPYALIMTAISVAVAVSRVRYL